MADEAPAAVPEAAGTPAPKNKLLPVVIAMYVGAALAGVTLVERVVVPRVAARAATRSSSDYSPASDEASDVARKKHGKGHGEHDGGNGEGGSTAGSVYIIEDLVVNPAGSVGTRYLAASVGMQSDLPTFLEDMKAKDAPIKDALIRILSSRTVDELADVAKRESIRQQIQAETDKLIPEEAVKAIYFVRFVLQ